MILTVLLACMAPKTLSMEPREWEIASHLAVHRQAQRSDAGHTLKPDSDRQIALDGETSAKPPPALMDLHVHQFAELGFGMRSIHGGGAPCDGLSHGLRPNFAKLILRHAPEMATDPLFLEMMPHCEAHDLPTHDSYAHEQYSDADLESAHDRGLGVIVNYAVTAGPLCSINQGHDASDETSCRDKENIERQVLATWEFATHHSWYRIALDPIDAWQARQDGDLAVLIGVEASDYFASHRFRGGILHGDPHFERRWRPFARQLRQRRKEADSRISPWTALSLEGAPLGADPAKLTTRAEVRVAGAARDHLLTRGITSAFLSHEWPSELSMSPLHNLLLFNPAYFVALRVGYLERIPLSLFAWGFALGGTGQRVGNWPISAAMQRDANLNKRYPAAQSGLTPLGAGFLDVIRGTNLIVDVGHASQGSVEETLAYYTGSGKPQMVIHGHVPVRELTLLGTQSYDYYTGRSTMLRLADYGRSALGYRTYNKPVKSFPGSVDNCVRGKDRGCFRDEGATLLADGDVVSLRQIHDYTATFGLPLGFGTDMNGGTFQTAPPKVLIEKDAPKAMVAAMSGDVLGLRELDQEDEREWKCLSYAGSVPHQVHCSDATGYARRGLATIKDLPALAADLTCIDGGDGVACADAFNTGCEAGGGLCPSRMLALMRGYPDAQKAAIQLLALLAPSDPSDVCATALEGTPTGTLCAGSRSFIERWAGLAQPGPTTGTSTQRFTEMRKMNVGIHAQMPPLQAAPISRVYGDATEYALVKRKYARIYLRDLRRRKALGEECRPLSEILAEREAKKNRKNTP